MGRGIDEALQVMTMISAGKDPEKIKNIVSATGDVQVVIGHVGQFVHPEIVDSINPEINYK